MHKPATLPIESERQSYLQTIGRPSLWPIALLGVLLMTASAGAADPFRQQREAMVQRYIASAGIKDRRVLQAMRDTPRHEFLPAEQRESAYYDMALPIGHGQTISPPYIVAFMTDQLDPKATDRVLEIGTGSGYQAAVLSPLVKEVYTIEIVEPLGQQAAETLRRLGYTNVFTKIGDGYAGWPEHAPFDKIIVTCSPEDIPQPLVDQLADEGLLIIPVGQRFQQTLCRFKKTGGRLEREPLQATFFVPMTGQSEAQRQVKPDLTKPTLVNGSFETTLDNSTDPDFWYYLREGRVQADASAPDGKHVLRFDNRVAGRSAQALQAFGIDGSQVHRLAVRLQVQARRVRAGGQPEQSAQAIVEFYGQDRAAVGRAVLGPWTGSFAWKPVTQEVDVPPSARLAVIGVGLFGATGQLSVDQVSVEAR